MITIVPHKDVSSDSPITGKHVGRQHIVGYILINSMFLTKVFLNKFN